MSERDGVEAAGRRRWPYLVAAALLITVVVLLLLADDTSGLYEIRR